MASIFIYFYFLASPLVLLSFSIFPIFRYTTCWAAEPYVFLKPINFQWTRKIDEEKKNESTFHIATRNDRKKTKKNSRFRLTIFRFVLFLLSLSQKFIFLTKYKTPKLIANQSRWVHTFQLGLQKKNQKHNNNFLNSITKNEKYKKNWIYL